MDKKQYQILSAFRTIYSLGFIGSFVYLAVKEFPEKYAKLKYPLLFGYFLLNVKFGNYYNLYFYKKAFDYKYKDVDNRNLENIIKSLEQNKISIK